MPAMSYKQIKTGTVLESLRSGGAVGLKELELDNDLSIVDFTFNEYIQFANCDFRSLDLSRCRFAKGFAFIGCVFGGEVSFEGARADGDCHFRACVFEEESRFDRLQVNGKLEVRAPRDISPLKGNRQRIGDENHNCQYAPYVVFKKHANFSQIYVAGEANFGSIHFLDGADFYNARISGPAFFRRDYCKEKDPQKRFADKLFEKPHFGGKKVRFRDAYFGGELNFRSAVFACEADFTYVHCQGIVFFNESDFKQRLNIEGGRFATSLRFDGAIFSPEHHVQLQDCRIAETLAFTNVPKRLSLTGCSYKRVQYSDPGALIKALKLHEEERKEFDKSSWIQLEASLRDTGLIQQADQVYRDRMGQERDLALPTYKRPFNRMWDLISGYGTEPWRLAIACCLIILLGVAAFYRGPLRAAPKENQTCGEPGRWSTAVETSLFQFSPFKLPVGENCAPAGWNRWVALLLRIAGWILVPLLAANLAGLLNRKAKSNPEGGGGED